MTAGPDMYSENFLKSQPRSISGFSPFRQNRCIKSRPFDLFWSVISEICLTTLDHGLLEKFFKGHGQKNFPNLAGEVVCTPL
jgi:hypothetical protein